MKELNTKGFSHVEALIVAVVLVVVGAVGFYVFNKVQDRSSRAESEEDNSAQVIQIEQVTASPEQKAALAKGYANALSQEVSRENAGQVVPEAVNCSNGRGTNGSRVELVYLTKSSNDNHAVDAEKIRQNAMGADVLFNNSAAKTNGTRKVRWVRNNQCKIVVKKVVSDDPHLWQVIYGQAGGVLNGQPVGTQVLVKEALKRAGLNKPDRKYITHVNTPDITLNCGIDIPARSDDQPGESNRNNKTSYQTIYTACWNVVLGNPVFGSYAPVYDARLLATRLAQAMGAPQASAPNARFYTPNQAARSFSGWLTDYYGILSVGPGNNTVPGQYGGTYDPSVEKCAWGTVTDATIMNSANWLLDCNNDDYFNTNPARGSYLKTHWNIANSKYLFAPAN